MKDFDGGIATNQEELRQAIFSAVATYMASVNDGAVPLDAAILAHAIKLAPPVIINEDEGDETLDLIAELNNTKK